MEFEACNLKDTRELAKTILDLLNGRNIILLEGSLGAGKTTLTQGLLEELRAEGPFTSPTFVVMKDYKLDGKKGFLKAFHFDCYRIDSSDLTEMSWHEVITNKDNLVVVEWPEKIKEALPKDSLCIKIEIVDESKRKFIIKNN
ncbi:tRNA (adenosine(37)-N6)-threonylcarbamoyltransferase complex ATPase subunit type 1 TsaE [bacterium]|jgi:tRNA threonylcarbamoyladenosine biosynthesis protein TsaE|nr:tRNA (adenosine(37)-N6)-threonylcarbamoyltransferase complex ATPase subunit type 1 TsaE [bacterium]MBT4598200.1 tRNA (adenosine(37)-N6)-threonylcarbamoyltransferase complex ATPase subunit type 1 TsaE [bacterium]MBT6753798.1 tRNA (adenosine(37)-N6)-threonylcarbamoyltransferase complex ATPase subunit type 1 TsaE [bacterium]MBT7037489.1 tRNA (adenosine(37)-N6)-threonylcarbamoyltransferase complex ATPase subunit type 1 TsaE [bacterium]MBT7432202.1 tRNA (adenosine(37)-N6)-threonylcarbamoyltransfe